MDIRVFKSKLQGSFDIPPSKSHSIRAIVLACFAEGTSFLKNVLNSDDVQSVLKIFSKLNCKFSIAHTSEDSIDIEVRPPSPNLYAFIQAQKGENFLIDCENSGTALYFLAVIFSFFDNISFTFIGDASLSQRPLEPLLEIFKKRGVRFSSNHNKLPLNFSGKFTNNVELFLDGKFSQCVSALFFSSAIFNIRLSLRLKVLGEAPYVMMTRFWLEKLHFNFQTFDSKSKIFEISPDDTKIIHFNEKLPSDWSAVAFPCLAALASKSELKINAIPDKTQGDYKIMQFLKDLGTKIIVGKDCFTILEKQNLKARKLDLIDNPDLVPAITAIASLAEGKSEIVNVEMARHKECDRVKATCSELKKLGIKITSSNNVIEVFATNKKLHAIDILESYKDHRIAMMLISLSLASENPVTIKDADCYKISFPSFKTQLKKCNAHVLAVSESRN